MSRESVHNFFRDIIGDTELIEELSHQDTEDLYVEKVVELGQRLGYPFDASDVRQTIADAKDNRAELSDAELEKAAGGAKPWFPDSSDMTVFNKTFPGTT